MSVIAEFELQSPLMRAASTTVPAMTIRGEEIFTLNGENPKYLFWAEGGSFEAFETALEADPSIRDAVVLTAIGDSRYYRVTFADDFTQYSSYDVASEHDIVFLDTEMQDGTALVRARAPSRPAFRSYSEFHKSRDIPFELCRLYEEDATRPTDAMVTANQREALKLAYERGYYDSPRETDLAELATDLDISRQAVADRLKRGTKRLVRHALR